jgi:hypothetical protein
VRKSVIVLALTAASVAHGATITVTASSGDGQPPLVTIDGDLKSIDGDEFRSKTSFLSKAVISFRSDGGSVVAGIQIGESIRLKGFTTVVSGNARCASACALAWLGGVRRFMSTESRIGFHAAYNKDGQETGVGNALIGAYLNKIGLPYSAVVYITQAAPDSMTWLSVAEAVKRGIDIELSPTSRAALANNGLKPWPAPAGPAPAAVAPPSGLHSAMAVGVAAGGVANGYATGFALNQPTEAAARSSAVEGCRKARNASADAREHCQAVVAWRNKCVASAVDPKSGTPGAGWGVGPNQHDADITALNRCRATAGPDRAAFCEVTDRACDGNVK